MRSQKIDFDDWRNDAWKILFDRGTETDENFWDSPECRAAYDSGKSPEEVAASR